MFFALCDIFGVVPDLGNSQCHGEKRCTTRNNNNVFVGTAPVFDDFVHYKGSQSGLFDANNTNADQNYGRR